ncbi:MAG: peptidyl-prolyl cis-trans isomerase [Acidobacteria bacterium]|nr:peptidyl-prolyl cis-trans isomerase [Acidobacteriota bacterium]
MLNIFRRRDTVIRVFVGSILVFISLAMVITLIPGLTGTLDDPALSQVVAEVGGEQITTWELQQTLLRASRSMQIPSDLVPLYTSQLLDQMVMEKAVEQEAQRLGLRVSEAEMVERLRQDPELFPGGRFVGEQQYEDMVFNRFGMTVPQFEDYLRTIMMQQKLQRIVTDAVMVTANDVRDAFYKENEKVVLSYIFLDPSTFRKDVAATDADLENYYRENKDRYQVPEKRQVEILLIDPAKVRQASVVSEAEVRRYYESRKDDYRSEERAQVSHILLKAQESEPEKMAEAKKKAEELVQKLRQGADFAALAKENSQDESNAGNGGDLGWIVRGQTVPEFEKTAFSLSPGTISDPVQTVYGVHILKVAAHEQARLRPLEEVRGEIESMLLDDKVQVSLTQTAEEAAAAWRRPGADSEALARKYHGTVLRPPAFAQGDFIEHIGAAPAFTQNVFILRKGEAGRPLAVPEGQAIPMVVEIFPAHPGELSEVKERVQEDYVSEQAQEKAQAKAQQLADALQKQAKKDLRQAARALGLSAQTSEPLTRQENVPGIGKVQDLGAQVFTMPTGEVGGPLNMTGGQIIYQVDSRDIPKEEDLEVQREAIRRRLLEDKRKWVFEVFQDELKRRLTASGDLKINSAALEQLSFGASSAP